jgi:catechol 2,3-dioxygenase-like lactoylglutathione lyase family enzyme
MEIMRAEHTFSRLAAQEVPVLGDKEAIATIAVKSVAAARKFYEGVLGLRPGETVEPGVVSYRSGGSSVLVYESRHARTNQATSVTWNVGGEMDKVVEGLKGKGVTFEHYDLPGTTRKGDVHHTGRSKAAWFTDPDGNILALVGQ